MSHSSILVDAVFSAGLPLVLLSLITLPLSTIQNRLVFGPSTVTDLSSIYYK
jgi:hypothetical protein